MEYHVDQASVPWKELGGGVRRKILSHTPELMSVLVEFDRGAVGAVHEHEVHTQASYVVKGSFEVEIAGAKKVLRIGDAFIAPPRTTHGVVALEQGSALLDVFTPRRDDFL